MAILPAMPTVRRRTRRRPRAKVWGGDVSAARSRLFFGGYVQHPGWEAGEALQRRPRPPGGERGHRRGAGDQDFGPYLPNQTVGGV